MDRVLTAAVRETQPENLATILYTSGTTGEPRGVMLSQSNLAGNTMATVDALGIEPSERRLGFLPLSHIYARTCDLYSWVCLGSELVLAENRDTVLRDCRLARPQTMNAVPYFYQKVYDQIRATCTSEPATALSELFGGRIVRCFCGGAALAPDVGAWFEEQGLPVLAGYGLTETSPVVSMSTLASRRSGYSGRPLPGVEVRLADDGEILVRGPNVMLGYWQNEAATRTAIRDGWFYTGDWGEIDADGFLAIRGRKKEIIVLSTGKNVAPTYVENLLSASSLIEQVMVVGDDRSYLAALIVPARAALVREMAQCGCEDFVWPDDLDSSPVQTLFRNEIQNRLSNAARAEQVHRFKLLSEGFSVERSELTPKLSLRREVICDHYRDEISALYDACPSS
jgi:long-chain acyl-CoA synthetase